MFEEFDRYPEVVKDYVDEWFYNCKDLDFFKEEEIDETVGQKVFYELASKVVLDNYIKIGEPKVTEEQFGETLRQVVIVTTMKGLVEKGYMTESLTDDGDYHYKLSTMGELLYPYLLGEDNTLN